jgi:hypothetical protein
MSDKIKELARKAGLIAPYGSDREGLRDFDYREFAELIVEECLDILDDEDDGSHDGRSVRIAAIRIKKLFGVEE